MIDDLDKTLEQLLKYELPPELVEQVTISFATPDAQFPPQAVTRPAINLFLYDIRENWELRQNDWRLEHDRNGLARQIPLARIDCSYLITAWASDSAPNPAQDEHRLLGAAMRVLMRYRKLPAQVLQGNLAGQEPPVRTKPLQPSHLNSLGEFWQAMGGQPRTALNYSLTISVDIGEPVASGVPVRETRI